jgi:diguanylate cyclase (GGDEF)-like protein
MRRFRLLFGSLAARLFWQTLILSVVPMLIVAVVALNISAGVIRTRLKDEGKGVAQHVAADLLERAGTTASTADLLAQSPTVRSLIETGDTGTLTEFLSSTKSQLGLDAIEITDVGGAVIASDGFVRDRPPDPALQSADLPRPASWALIDEPQGMTLRARHSIEGTAGETLGRIDVGVSIGPSFLDARRTDSRVELALLGNHELRVATFPLSGAKLPDSQTGKTGSVTVGGAHYLATFQTIESQTDERVTLLVLTPLSTLPSMTRTLWLMLLGLIVCLCIVIVFLTRKMVLSIIAPFQRLVSSLLLVRDGDLGAHVPATSQDEIGALEVAFNTMVDSLEDRRRERANHKAELVYRAFHDALTGLPNRNLLQKELDAAVAEAHRGKPISLMYLDFDQFKLVNDTLGHESGDRLLSLLAEPLRSVLRDEDTLARLGGDEFAVLLPGLHMEDAVRVAERVRGVINDFRFIEGGRSFALGVSVGVTAITPSVSASEALRQADVACYAAKMEGRNRVKMYTPDEATFELLADEGLWIVEIKDALQDNRLRLVFQPIVQLKGRSIDHYETLVRLVNRDGTLIKPPAFIRAAERSGLIRDIDHWVLNAALDRIGQENALGNPVNLAINISGDTLDCPDAPEFIRHAIESKRVDPRTLTFEVAEAALWTSLNKRHETIDALRRIGCSIALDGFGAESSSFANLSQLPVDSIKIDGSFVRDVNTNAINRSIVEALSLIIHAFNKPITAEWVENSETLSILRRLDIDLAQGHFIGYPSSYLADSSWPIARVAGRRATRTGSRI